MAHSAFCDALDSGHSCRAAATNRARVAGLFGPDEGTPEFAANTLLGDEGWHLQRVIDAVALPFPLVLEIPVDDPFDNFFSADLEKIGILWDDHIVAAGPISVREGSVVQIPIATRLGERLSVFATADVVTQVTPQTQADAAASLKKRKDDEGRGLFDGLGARVDTVVHTLGIIEALVVVLVVGGVFYLASQVVGKTDTNRAISDVWG